MDLEGVDKEILSILGTTEVETDTTYDVLIDKEKVTS